MNHACLLEAPTSFLLQAAGGSPLYDTAGGKEEAGGSSGSSLLGPPGGLSENEVDLVEGRADHGNSRVLDHPAHRPAKLHRTIYRGATSGKPRNFPIKLGQFEPGFLLLHPDSS